ncbi:hypothetical protein ACFOU2_11010 [Bacillus songklensis]|uniref:Uncharacterized protein n=1 Tax=Bacillus songklensis TaxID=1069116 RepID=A0ABV8B370_9BACI
MKSVSLIVYLIKIRYIGRGKLQQSFWITIKYAVVAIVLTNMVNS